MLLKLKKERPQLKSTFQGYLFGICRNLWLKKIERQGVRLEEDSVLNYEKATQVVLFEDEGGGEELISLETERDIIIYRIFKSSLSRLAERCRQLLTLQTKGLSYEAIKVKMGFPSIGRVGKKRHDCMKQIKKIVHNHPDFKELY